MHEKLIWEDGDGRHELRFTGPYLVFGTLCIRIDHILDNVHLSTKTYSMRDFLQQKEYQR